jgi:hypothetical protein
LWNYARTAAIGRVDIIEIYSMLDIGIRTKGKRRSVVLLVSLAVDVYDYETSKK